MTTPNSARATKDLRQNDTDLNGALEVPVFQTLLPELSGLRILDLDLGCGFGDFARYGGSQRAEYVEAIDISEKNDWPSETPHHGRQYQFCMFFNSRTIRLALRPLTWSHPPWPCTISVTTRS